MAGLPPRFLQAPPTRCTAVAEICEIKATSLKPFVAQNEPCVLRGVLADWEPVRRWDDQHIRATCRHRTVPIRHSEASSERNFGRLDRSGVYTREGGVTVPELLDALANAHSKGQPAAMYAAQVRLRTHLPELLAEARPEPGCLEALGTRWRNSPSLYMGCGARTHVHFDLLENVMCVVRGRKSVTLWHPADSMLLYPGGGGSELFSRVADPLEASSNFPLLCRAAPFALHVELSAGDALYIPCCWWHDVRTPRGERSLSISYWCQQPLDKL